MYYDQRRLLEKVRTVLIYFPSNCGFRKPSYYYLGLDMLLEGIQGRKVLWTESTEAENCGKQS